MELRLSPAGHLSCQVEPEQQEEAAIASLYEVFQRDWREGLFTLGAEKVDDAGSFTLRYWREFADHFLTGLCHLPEEVEDIEVETPSSAEFASLLLSAPPMQGGEYLSEAMLRKIWGMLEAWVEESIPEEGLTAFLQERAPLWHQVGRVCFHLAENKNDEDRPFAFLATYAAGFGAGGKVKHLPLGKALKEYAGAQNRTRLLKLLRPVQQATEACPWVKELVASGGIYRPMAWTPEQAYQFLRSVADLEQSGLTVRLPDWWKKRYRPQVSVNIDAQRQATMGVDAMLYLNVRVALGEQNLTEEELEALLEGEDGLVLFKGQWVEVDKEKLQEALAHWESLQQEARDGEISFIEGMRLLAGASSDLKSDALTEQHREWVHVGAGDTLREMLAGLRDPSQLEEVPIGSGLQATLRHYQEEGVAWLQFLTRLGLGACLADDMGLGKTIQIIALLLHYQQIHTEQRQPSLLVVPASLLGNWKSEANRFAPSLRLTFLHPSETPAKTIKDISKNPTQHLADTDLAVTTYSMLTRQPWLSELEWNLAILDEAQAIKNPGTKQTKATKQIKARARIILTGTPVENRLGDLWSLFDFINPGLLGSSGTFKTFIKNLQARQRDKFAPLRRLVGPYILRRMKTDPTIISDLPDKTETTRFCHLSKHQIKLYQQVVDAMREGLNAKEDMARRGIVLQSLMRLKQVCNHPSQLLGDGTFDPKHSGKFQRLAEICEELADRQEKVLVFTQFREIIDPLAEHLSHIFQRHGLILHGGTSVKKRKDLVAEFQREDGPPFFILSLKAGGTGLNLTAANHVIHFDRWWNPAVENQATDRAFRIGQKRNVLVHKFVTSGTVEERIDEMIREKQQLANEILAEEDEINVTELSDDELIKLVQLDVNRATF